MVKEKWWTNEPKKVNESNQLNFIHSLMRMNFILMMSTKTLDQS